MLIVPSDQFLSYEEKNLEIVTVPTSPLNSHIRWLPYSYFFGKVISRKVNTEKFDIIHFTDARESLFCKAHIPTVGNVNDTYLADVQDIKYYLNHYQDGLIRWGYYKISRMFEVISLRKIDQIIANSSYTAKVIRTKYGISQEKINICYKSIDFVNFRKILSSLEKSSRTHPRILFVGNNFQRKGLMSVINSSVEVLRHFPNTEFWIVGKDKQQKQFEKICKNLGVEGSFSFLGPKSPYELIKIYNESDIFVMPSLTEAFGVVFLEAMACGLVVIGTHVGGIPEIIENGVNGILIPPNNPNKLSEAIVSLLENRNMAEKFVKNALEGVKMFSTENMMKCTYKVYEKALSSVS
ncbi:MAG: hypothetical protein KatS3mg083_641 [Candidatus Dojkabacteria bacterium]|nr:MAG: hypothetical protein KatS3mg083_641 [Candidatus Dojkabacteria bacterium]